MAGATVKQLTLLLLRVEGRVLLGMKKRGFGAGKLNGFGGKIEPGESILQAALREMKEESGLEVLDAELVGNLRFDFLGCSERLEVHVLRASAFRGEPVETEEMKPDWIAIADIPYERMWLDDEIWLPLLLAGKSFVGTFTFRGHTEIVAHSLREVGGEGLHSASLPHLPSARLVREAQSSVTAE